MKKPVVGLCVTPQRNVELKNKFICNSNYTKLLAEAGCVPFIIPVNYDTTVDMAQDYIDQLDGLFIPGGADCNPKFFGESTHPTVKSLDTMLDNMELALLEKAVKKGIPVLGVCRGMQLMNIAFGGDLYQDIPSQLKGTCCHSQSMNTRDEASHKVTFKKTSELGKALGTKEVVYVNSFHHQCLRKIGEGFEVVATADDGVVEAIENKAQHIYGVQFHPEELFQRYPRFLAIAKLFAKKAAEIANQKNKK